MITRRALLIYHFGIAALLLVIGAVSVYAVDVGAPGRLTEMPTFDRESRTTLSEERDVEALRSRSLFYFDLGRELKKARVRDTVRLFYDVRTFAFVVAALFALGGLMLLSFRQQPPEPGGSPEAALRS